MSVPDIYLTPEQKNWPLERPADETQPDGTITKAPPPRDIMGLVYLLAFVKLSKTPAGLKVLNNLAGKAIDGYFSAVKGIAVTGPNNDVSAWGSNVIVSTLGERLGFIPPGFNAQFHMGLSMIAGAKEVEDMTRAIGGLFKFSRTQKGENTGTFSYTEGNKTVVNEFTETTETKRQFGTAGTAGKARTIRKAK